MPADPNTNAVETTTEATTTTKKAAGKKTGAKAATKKAAKKAGKKAPAKAAKKAEGGLSGNAMKVLTALKNTAAGGKTMTRAQLAEKTGIAKGWSKLLGSPTVDAKSHGLEGAGLVKSVSVEGERGLQYHITAAGKKALEKA